MGQLNCLRKLPTEEILKIKRPMPISTKEFEELKHLEKGTILKEKPERDIFSPIDKKYPKEIKGKVSDSYIKNIMTKFLGKRKPVAAPPAHVPADSTAFAEQASDSVAAFLTQHGVGTPAAGIGKYAAPKPATRAGI